MSLVVQLDCIQLLGLDDAIYKYVLTFRVGATQVSFKIKEDELQHHKLGEYYELKRIYPVDAAI